MNIDNTELPFIWLFWRPELLANLPQNGHLKFWRFLNWCTVFYLCLGQNFTEITAATMDENILHFFKILLSMAHKMWIDIICKTGMKCC